MISRLLCVGVRGWGPGNAAFEADIRACERAGVGAVILFDVHLAERARLGLLGRGADGARALAARNIIDPDQTRALIAHLRERLGRQVLIAIDQEGGRVARLTPARGFAADPSAAEFARLDAAAQREAAERQARQLAGLGIDLNFAPCVDLARHEAGVIAPLGRSFGDEAEGVARCARVVLEAHRRAGVGACVKHFPGHGSAAGDTHVGLADITATHGEDEARVFEELAEAPAMMAGHLLHRGVDAERPASLSRAWLTGVLRDRVGYGGVIATDSIDMGAVRDRWSAAEACVLAVEAGADLVVHGFNAPDDMVDAPHPAPAMARALAEALEAGRLDRRAIDASLARLAALRGAGPPATMRV